MPKERQSTGGIVNAINRVRDAIRNSFPQVVLPAKIPNSFLTMNTPTGTTSATLEDVPGTEMVIRNNETTEIAVFAAFELATQSGAAASTIAIALNINGVDCQELQRYLSGSNDSGIGCSVSRSVELPPGNHTVKLRYRRVSGVATPGVNVVNMFAFALEGAHILKDGSSSEFDPDWVEITTVLPVYVSSSNGVDTLRFDNVDYTDRLRPETAFRCVDDDGTKYLRIQRVYTSSGDTYIEVVGETSVKATGDISAAYYSNSSNPSGLKPLSFFRASLDGASASAPTGITQVPLSASDDPNSNFDAGNDEWESPITIFYNIDFSSGLNGLSNAGLQVYVTVDGVTKIVDYLIAETSTGGFRTEGQSKKLLIPRGSKVRLYINHSDSTTRTILSGSNRSYLDITPAHLNTSN